MSDPSSRAPHPERPAAGQQAVVSDGPIPSAPTGVDRLAAFTALGLLGGAPGGTGDAAEPFVRVARLAARALDAPVAQINLVTDGRQVPAAAHVEPPADVATWSVPVGFDRAYCQHVVAADGGRGVPLVVDDVREVAALRESRVHTEAGVVAYAAAPIRNERGLALGTVCVVDFRPRAWGDAARRVLEDLAALTAHEIALRARAAEAVLARAERLARLLDTSPAAVIEVAPDGRFVYANPAAERLLALSRAELTGDAFGAYDAPAWQLTAADGTPLPAERLPAARALRGEVVLDAEHAIVHPATGRRHVLAVNAAPIRDLDGRVVGALASCTDVTARHAAEQERREAERRLRRIAESGIVGLLYWTRDGRIVDANDRFLELIGRTRAELAAGALDWRAITPPGWAAVDAEIAAALATEGVAPPHEKEYLRPDGQRVRLVLAGATLDAAGTTGVTVAVDVSARARAEARSARLQALTAALNEARTPDDVAAAILAEGRAALGADAVAVVRVAADDPRMLEIVRAVGWPDGALAPWQRLPITAPDGGPLPPAHDSFMSAAVRAGAPVWASSAEEAERRFPAVADLVAATGFGGWLAIPFVLADAEPDAGRHAARTAAGPSPEPSPSSERPVRDAAELAAPAPRGYRVLGGIGVCFRGPRAFPADERTLLEAMARQCALALERTRLAAAEAAARQEAERQRAEAERQRAGADDARRDAEAANRAKSEFLAAMSHELRTPINAQVGYAELLDLGVAGPLTAQQREYVARLTASSRHLLGLVNDVLDLAKVDAGEMTVQQTTVSAAGVLVAALDLVRPQADARRVHLAVTPATESPHHPPEPTSGPTDLRFVGDEHRVRQIVVNLLANAIKFSAPDGRVMVRCASVASPPPDVAVHGAGPWVTITVEDAGIGIPAAERGRLFEPFQQVHADGGTVYTRKHSGTGLGLAISRRLARLMGGDLTLDRSAPGEGSVFTVWLPGIAAGEAADARAARADRASAPLGVAGLDRLGALLREHADQVLRAYAARLRVDPATPSARTLPQAQLEDHSATYLADLAQSLVIVGGASAQRAQLLADGGAIQRVIAEHHGVRRHTQGWTEAEVAHELDVLAEEVERIVQTRLGADAVSAAEALAVLRQLMTRGRTLSLAAWRRAHEQVVGPAGASRGASRDQGSVRGDEGHDGHGGHGGHGDSARDAGAGREWRGATDADDEVAPRRA